jgi:endoglucanase
MRKAVSACLLILIAWVSAAGIGLHGSSVSLGNFATATHVSNIYALRKIYPTYSGPAIRLQRASDSAQMDFNFNAAGNLPRQAIQDWATSRSIAIAIIYDQSPSANHLDTSSMGAAPILTLVNSLGYPEVTVAAGEYMISNSPSSGQGLQTVIARMNATSGVLLSQDIFSLQFRMLSNAYLVAPNSGGTSVSLGSNTGWANLAGSFSDLYSTNNVNGFQNGSLVASSSVAAFTFAPAGGGTEFDVNHFRFGGQDYIGSWQEIIVTYDELTPTVIGNFNTTDNTYYSTTLPDPLSALPPQIAGAGPTVTVVGKSNMPFIHGGGAPSTFQSVNVTVADVGNTDSATLTLSGSAGGTLTGTGLSGSGPYTLASATPATITSELQSIVYNPGSATATQTETITLLVTSSSTALSTDANTVITVKAVAPAETAFAAPSGTFTPINYKGVNISGAEFTYPSSSQYNYIYPENTNTAYWGGKGMGLIRMPIHQLRLQPDVYGPLDPVSFVRNSTNCPRLASPDGLVGRCDEPAQSAFATSGTQTNLTAMKAVIDYAFSQNMYVMIDDHLFGQVNDTLLNYSIIYPGISSEATAQLVDFWTRMATKFKNYPNVIFDVMNEPNVQTAAQWFTAQTAVNTAIASVTTAQLVMIEGTCYTGGHSWVSCGNSTAWAGYTPPAGLQVAYEMHEYLDSDFSGTHAACAGNGSAPMTAATSWAVTNSVKIFIGETGWSQDSSCPPDATNLFNYFSANEVSASGPYMGWSYWVGGDSAFYSPTSYILSAVPSGYPSGPFTDNPQTSILVSHLP